MFRRWRNSRGFGVHSPFGYQLVELVFKPQKGYAYYAYGDIEKCCRRLGLPSSTAERAKMLLRLICILKPKSVYLPADAPRIFATALKGADSGIRLIRNEAGAEKADVIATCGEALGLERLSRFISLTDRTLLLKDVTEEWCDRLFQAMNEGIMIRGKSNAIFISRHDMQKVSYLMNI